MSGVCQPPGTGTNIDVQDGEDFSPPSPVCTGAGSSLPLTLTLSRGERGLFLGGGQPAGCPYGLRARSCSWRSCCCWWWCQVSKRVSRPMRSRRSRILSFFCCCSSLALLLAALSLLLSLDAAVFLCGRIVEALQLPRPVRPLLALYLLVGAPVPLFLLCLLLGDTLALLSGERGVHLCDFGMICGKVFADAEAVGVAAGGLEHELCAGERTGLSRQMPRSILIASSLSLPFVPGSSPSIISMRYLMMDAPSPVSTRMWRMSLLVNLSWASDRGELTGWTGWRGFSPSPQPSP